VRASGDNVYLVWVNESNQPIEVHYSRSTDQGGTWSDEIDIAEDSLGAQVPFMAVQDTHVVVCWMGYKYSPYWFTGDLFIRQSFDSGVTWDDEQVLTDLHKVRIGTVFCEDTLISAVWMDNRFGGGNDEVMTRTSYDYGQIWTESERLSFGDDHSYEPISCKTDDIIHVLWGDIRPGAPGLYYCRNDLSTGINDGETIHPTNIYIHSYPNPFNANTIITYRGLEEGDIEIFNIAGQLVKAFSLSGKEGLIIWDASDENGNRVSSGIYFIRATTTTGYASRRILYLK
jgi:hypothetical protein